MCCPLCPHFPCNMYLEGNNECCEDCPLYWDCNGDVVGDQLLRWVKEKGGG